MPVACIEKLQAFQSMAHNLLLFAHPVFGNSPAQIQLALRGRGWVVSHGAYFLPVAVGTR